MRTPPMPWPGFLADLLRVSRCTVRGDRRVGAIEIWYQQDGRPAKATLALGNLPAECSAAMAAIARLTLADAQLGVIDGERQVLVLPLHDDFVGCVGEITPPRRVGAARPGEPVVAQPEKIRDVKPVYPQSAQAAGVQGVVILEAVLSPAGCTTSISVRRSVAPLIDVAAIQAVSRWKFKPAQLDSQPVPALSTLTVYFRLQ
jgi:TonB family protein